MAEKRLDIKVAASATGVEEVKQQIKGLGDEAKKAGGGGREPGGIRGFFHGLHEQEKDLGLRGIENLTKGAGAFAGLHLLAEGLQKLPASLNEFRASVNNGDSGFRAFGEALVNVVPVIGELRKGILDAAEAFDDLVAGRDRAKELATEEEAQRNSVLLSKVQLAAVKGLSGRNNSASDAAELIGLDDFDKQRKLLARGFNDFTSQFDKDKAAAGVLPDDRKEQALAALNKRWDDEVAIYTEKSREITAIEREKQEEVAHSFKVQMHAYRQFFRDSVMEWKVFLGRVGDTVKGAFHGKFLQSQGFNQDVMGMRSGLLGDMGPGFQTEADRAKIQENIAGRRLDIQRRLDDPMLDKAQKTLLEDMFKELPALEREMLSNVGRESTGPNRAQLENTRFLTGAGSPAEFAKKTEKNTAEQARFARLLYEFLTRQTAAGTTPSFLTP